MRSIGVSSTAVLSSIIVDNRTRKAVCLLGRQNNNSNMEYYNELCVRSKTRSLKGTFREQRMKVLRLQNLQLYIYIKGKLD